MKKIISIFLFYLLFTSKLFALIEVDITRGNLDPLPIAVSPLHVDVKSEDYKDLKIKEYSIFLFEYFIISKVLNKYWYLFFSFSENLFKIC